MRRCLVISRVPLRYRVEFVSRTKHLSRILPVSLWGVGRRAGVGRGLGVGAHLPVHRVGVDVGAGVDVGVTVGVAVAVGLAVGVAVGVRPVCAQYLPPLSR